METQILKCSRSGLPLLEVKSMIGGGAWPLTHDALFKRVVHPIYGRPLHRIVRSLDMLSLQLEDAEYIFPHTGAYQEAALHISAGMHAIEAIWEPHPESTRICEPSIPCEAVTVSCLRRFASLLSWYQHETSKRIDFPLYKPSHANTNQAWDNFAAWLDACADIKHEWAVGKADYDMQDELDARSEAEEFVSTAHIYSKLDQRKVWNWIRIQLEKDGRYASGRIQTFETIYLMGEREPDRWTNDDIEDVQLAISECCDVRNDVYQFILKRLRNIAHSIAEFLGGFNVLDTPAHKQTAQEKEKTDQLLADYDAQLVGLVSLPPQPRREDFSTLALFLKANAQHSILSRRWKLLQNKAAPDAAADQL